MYLTLAGLVVFGAGLLLHLTRDVEFRVIGRLWMVIGLTLFAMTFLINCAPSRTGKALNVALVGSGVADLVTTRQAIDSGRGREGNPLLDHGVWTQGLLKAAGISAVMGGAFLLEMQGKPVIAHVLRGAISGLWIAISVRNDRLGRE